MKSFLIYFNISTDINSNLNNLKQSALYGKGYDIVNKKARGLTHSATNVIHLQRKQTARQKIAFFLLSFLEKQGKFFSNEKKS